MSSKSCDFSSLPRPGCDGWPALLGAWLPVLLLLVLLGVESTACFGADRTSAPLHALAHAITGACADREWSLVHHVIRKSGHFFGYGLFSVAVLRALARNSRPARRLLNAARAMQLAAVAATFAIAGLDELHQSFVPNRTGKFSDVLLDTAGAVALQFALRLITRIAGFLKTQRRAHSATTEFAASGATLPALLPLH